MKFFNSYEDMKRAESYSRLEFPNTYYLAYRDLPEILQKYVKGNKAIDFGCGTGRSTRFLRKYGYSAIGIDISNDMIKMAKSIDPAGDYRLIKDCDFGEFKQHHYDLIFSAFTFDNIPHVPYRIRLLKELTCLINNEGIIILLDATPDIYIHEWASFSTKNFPENKYTKRGEIVKIIIKDVQDKRPVEDIIWFHEDYLRCFDIVRLKLVETYKPLGKLEEPYQWVNETRIAPWIIYVLKNNKE